ncbi:hypothetical protein KUCAC02_028094, partial [Chaenocephalus aceratus]
DSRLKENSTQQSLVFGWWEERVAVQELWRWNMRENGDQWRATLSFWSLKTAGVICRELDCGSAVSVGEREESSWRPAWGISSLCVESGSALRECAAASFSSYSLTLTCS